MEGHAQNLVIGAGPVGAPIFPGLRDLRSLHHSGREHLIRYFVCLVERVH